MFNEAFWIALSFFILLLLIYKPAKAKIFGVLDEKIKKIQEEIDKVNCLKKEASDILEQYQQRQKEIAKETQQIIDNAEAEVARITERAERDVQKYTEEKNRAMMSKIESLESEAIKNLRFQAVAEAMKVIDQIINDKLDRKEAERLLSESIAGVATSIEH